MPDPRSPCARSVLDAVVGRRQAPAKAASARPTRPASSSTSTACAALEKQIQKLQQNPPSLAACGMPPKPLDAYADVEGARRCPPSLGPWST